jgi:Leucine-rich repeat (LRR) protein
MELGSEQKEPTAIFTDSQSAVKLLKNLRTLKNGKGARRAVHNVRYALNIRMIKLVFIDGEHNAADIHTKLLRTRHSKLMLNDYRTDLRKKKSIYLCNPGMKLSKSIKYLLTNLRGM